jgi:hypothetical protein
MSNLPDRNVVLIAGVHGVSGRAAAEHWAALPGTRVYGLSRRSAPLPAGVEAIVNMRVPAQFMGTNLWRPT